MQLIHLWRWTAQIEVNTAFFTLSLWKQFCVMNHWQENINHTQQRKSTNKSNYSHQSKCDSFQLSLCRYNQCVSNLESEFSFLCYTSGLHVSLQHLWSWHCKEMEDLKMECLKETLSSDLCLFTTLQKWPLRNISQGKYNARKLQWGHLSYIK